MGALGNLPDRMGALLREQRSDIWGLAGVRVSQLGADMSEVHGVAKRAIQLVQWSLIGTMELADILAERNWTTTLDVLNQEFGARIRAAELAGPRRVGDAPDVVDLALYLTIYLKVIGEYPVTQIAVDAEVAVELGNMLVTQRESEVVLEKLRASLEVTLNAFVQDAQNHPIADTEPVCIPNLGDWITFDEARKD